MLTSRVRRGHVVIAEVHEAVVGVAAFGVGAPGSDVGLFLGQDPVNPFNRTLLDEWADVRAYRSESERRRRLDRWLHTYNHHRCHTAPGGHPPIRRVDNLSGQYS